MKTPDDLRLRTAVQIVAHRSQQDTLNLIDKDYEIRHTFLITEFGMAQAVKTRTEMLSAGDLLAVVVTGWRGDTDDFVVCETYPGPGQVERFTLSSPRPRFTWCDQDEPDAQDALISFGEIWSLDRL